MVLSDIGALVTLVNIVQKSSLQRMVRERVLVGAFCIECLSAIQSYKLFLAYLS